MTRDHRTDVGVDARAGSVPPCPMSMAEIIRCIPHRFPFLLIDRILEVVLSDRIVASRCVTSSDPMLVEHFPGNLTVPRVLLVEGIAQAAAVFGHLSSSMGLRECLLTEVSSARFRHQASPGDVIVFDVRLVRQRGSFHWFEGSALVQEHAIAEVKLSAYMK